MRPYELRVYTLSSCQVTGLRAGLVCGGRRPRRSRSAVYAKSRICPNKQTAAELEVSEMTVKVHRGQVMRKMQARSLPELVRMADSLGMPATTSAGVLYQSRGASRPASSEFVLSGG